jgi:hypothetical protein
MGGMTMVLTGGCLCGAIRYEISADGGEVVDYCHCRQCRAASGAPVLPWIQVPPASFRLTAGAAKGFASSTHATRWFCPECGGQIYMTDINDKSVGVTLGTLDDANLVQPTVHGWTDARLRWFDTTDDLPRYPEYPPYDL